MAKEFSEAVDKVIQHVFLFERIITEKNNVIDSIVSEVNNFVEISETSKVMLD